MQENRNLNFALIGASGYIAPRHMKAVRDTGNKLVSALDPYDSAGILDSYFPDADFFIEPERFDRHLDKLRRNDISRKVSFVSICSPNYMHDSHIRMALRNEAYAICEKPVVLNPWNVDALINIEKETGKRIYTILQVRLHPAIIALKEKIEKHPDVMHDVDLTYITSRGKWYFRSWKGQIEKSGGIATNIGVHFFDLLSWIFGPVKMNKVHILNDHRAGGFLQFEKARVRWFLSLDQNDLPENIKEKGQRTYRSLTVGNEEVEFSEGFTELHTESYKQIISGKGFGILDAKTAIEIVHDIRVAEQTGLKGDYHPLLGKIKM